ncbi:hypothetical protein [Microbacterium terregens]|uniref:Uncharacterized protein n=1 Tax=Microbacterium terregens TaxID=69363 RepID=A0ABV5T0W3_9MICO
MLDFLRQALSVTPVVIALLLVRAVNTPKLTRVRQYPMPFVAVIYAVAALAALHALNSHIDDLLRSLFQSVPFLRGLYDTTWQYVLENTAVLVVFVIVKILVRGVFDRLFQGEAFQGSSLAESVYRYDPEYAMWFVRTDNGMLRQYLRVFFWVSVAMAVALIALVGMFPTWPGFAAISFPALAALVVGEFAYAVDGVTKREYRGDVLGEEDKPDRVTDYAGMRDVLKQTFPERVLDDGVIFSSSDSTQTFGRLDALAHSADEVDRLVAGYFSRLKQSGRILDTNLIGVAADLMRGRSALISNPFYPDLTAYLAFPAYFHLLQSSKCLIICGRDSIAADLVAWMDEGLEGITGVPDLWRVDLLSTTANPELDVGVLRFADVHNLDIVRANDDFLRDVDYVIFAEPSRTLATGQVGLGLVLNRCGGDSTPVFAAFDRNHDGLVDTLSHLLKVDLTDVVAAALPRGVSTDMIWRPDGAPMHAAVLPAISRYLGMGIEIGAVALKYQVAAVDWVGGDAFPVQDMMWIAGQYYSEINAFADLELSQHALTDAIRPVSNPWDVATATNRFLIVEDEIRNVYESIRLYSTRAQDEGFVNLISEDYLLRDYMVANSRIFAADPKAIPSIVPDFARTERNLVLRLLLTLLTFGMSETALTREFELIGRQLPPIVPPRESDADEEERDAPVIMLLRDLIGVHTGIRAAILDKSLVPEGAVHEDRGVQQRHYRIPEGTPVDRVVEELHAAYFFVEDEAEGRDYLGSTLYGLVYQVMLPGQFVTYAGKHYEVQSIGRDVRRSGVVLRRAAEHIRDRHVYRPLRSFALRERRVDDQSAGRRVVGEVSLTHTFATIEVATSGYLELPSRADLPNGRQTLVSGIPLRVHTNKELLEIRLPGVAASTRRTITLLLNELFVTVFPDSHQYVVALTSDPDGSFSPLLDGLTAEDDDGGDDVIFIVEDSPIDMGLTIAVERNWRRLLEIISDYLLWQTEGHERPGTTPVTDVPVFPDDAPEDVAQRRHIAAEQDAIGAAVPRAPRRLSWWMRFRRWVSRVRAPAGSAPAEDATPAASTDAATPAVVRVDSSPVDDAHPAEPVGVPSVPVEFASEPEEGTHARE